MLPTRLAILPPCIVFDTDGSSWPQERLISVFADPRNQTHTKKNLRSLP